MKEPAARTSTRETAAVGRHHSNRGVTAAAAGSAATAGLTATGAADDAVLDVIFGRFNPTGTLPFEMPSSMEAVRNQQEDVPYDSGNPLFPFGHGLSYAADSTAAVETDPSGL